MKRTKITSEIEYVRPSNVQSGMVCCGIIFHSSPTILIDTCLEEENIAKLLKKVQPEIVITTHFHIDHSCMLQFVPQYTIPSPGRDPIPDQSGRIRQTAGTI